MPKERINLISLKSVIVAATPLVIVAQHLRQTRGSEGQGTAEISNGRCYLGK